MSSLANRAKGLAIADDELLAKIAAGDLASLGAFYDRYAHDVRRFVGRLGTKSADLDDIVQQTFLVVIDASRGFDGRAGARPWLFGLATNVVRRHRRSIALIARSITAWGREPRIHAVASAADDLELREAAAFARKALDGLSWKKREVFVLVVLEGLTGEQAAAALSIPVATVWTRLHHARNQLRVLLEDEP